VVTESYMTYSIDPSTLPGYMPFTRSRYFSRKQQLRPQACS
jgi:hypothetical protein